VISLPEFHLDLTHPALTGEASPKGIARGATPFAQPKENMETTNNLPPDPEEMNDLRAAWAGAALCQFRTCCRTDYEDALGDLLCDLMHWADRANFDFDAALFRARMHYEAETTSYEPN
jgi:hypothetical protein